MRILGLNAYHGDSAACLFVDGKLIAAAAEERFRRIKHWAGLPTTAINYVLEAGEISLGRVAQIAHKRQPARNNTHRLGFVLTHVPPPHILARKIEHIRRDAARHRSPQADYRN